MSFARPALRVTFLNLALVGLSACTSLKSCVVDQMTPDWGPGVAGAAEPIQPTFDGADAARSQVPVVLRPVLGGAKAVTDIQLPPGSSDRMVVTLKGGEAKAARKGADGAWSWDPAPVLQLEVLTSSEQGLLGWAFHPQFAQTGQVFVNYSTRSGGEVVSRVSRFTIADPAGPWTAGGEEVVLEVRQPYSNHNAGQLAFGPDGMLYIGWGDGGWADDPHGNGQDLGTWLGAMLRVDVDSPPPKGAGYVVPPDNPYVGKEGVRPEIWASGLRNPWRYSFDPTGRLVVADVGQNAWEEVDLVARGDNLGWNSREARHCFPLKVADCPGPFVDPIYEYGHAEGSSITGGYVYTGATMPQLSGRYVFGDFTSGRLWAITLPEAAYGPLVEAVSLGRFGVLLSTFGQGADGELYLGDFGGGGIFRLEAASGAQ